MKKLLSVLATLVVTTSSASTVLAFTNANDKNDDNKNGYNEDNSIGANNNHDDELHNTIENPKLPPKEDNNQLTPGNNEQGNNSNVDSSKEGETIKNYPKPVIDFGSKELKIRNINGNIDDWSYGLIRIHNVFELSALTELKITDNSADKTLTGDIDLSKGAGTYANDANTMFNVERVDHLSDGYVDLKVNVNVAAVKDKIADKVYTNITEIFGNVGVKVTTHYEENKITETPDETNSSEANEIKLGINYVHYKDQFNQKISNQAENGIAKLGELSAVYTDDSIFKDLSGEATNYGNKENKSVFIVDKATKNQALLKTAILRKFEADNKALLEEYKLDINAFEVKGKVNTSMDRATIQVKKEIADNAINNLMGSALFKFDLADINIGNHIPPEDNTGTGGNEWNPDLPTGNVPDDGTGEGNDGSTPKNPEPDPNDENSIFSKGLNIGTIVGYDRLRLYSQPDELETVLKNALFNSNEFKPFISLKDDPKLQIDWTSVNVISEYFTIKITEGNKMGIKPVDLKVKFNIEKANLNNYITAGTEIGSLQLNQKLLEYNAKTIDQKSAILNTVYGLSNENSWLKGKINVNLDDFVINNKELKENRNGKKYNATILVNGLPKKENQEENVISSEELISDDKVSVTYSLEAIKDAGSILNPPGGNNNDSGGNPVDKPDAPSEQNPGTPGEDGTPGESGGDLPTIDPNKDRDPSTGGTTSDNPMIDAHAKFEGTYLDTKEEISTKFMNYMNQRYKQLSGKIEIDKDAKYGDKDAPTEIANWKDESVKGKTVWETFNAWDPSTWNFVLKPTSAAAGEITSSFAVHVNMKATDITNLVKSVDLGKIASKFYSANTDTVKTEILNAVSEQASQKASTFGFSDEFTPEIIKKLITVNLNEGFNSTDKSTWKFTVTPKKFIESELKGSTEDITFDLTNVSIHEIFNNEGVLDMDTIPTDTLEDKNKSVDYIKDAITSGKNSEQTFIDAPDLSKIKDLITFIPNDAKDSWNNEKGSVIVKALNDNENAKYITDTETINFKRTQVSLDKVLTNENFVSALKEDISKMKYNAASEQVIIDKTKNVISNLFKSDLNTFAILGVNEADVETLEISVKNDETNVLNKIVKVSAKQDLAQGNKFSGSVEFNVAVQEEKVGDIIKTPGEGDEAPLTIEDWSVANMIKEANKAFADSDKTADWTKTTLKDSLQKNIANRINEEVNKKPEFDGTSVGQLTNEDIIISSIKFKPEDKAEFKNVGEVEFTIAPNKGYGSDKNTWAISLAKAKQSDIVNGTLLNEIEASYQTDQNELQILWDTKFNTEYPKADKAGFTAFDMFKFTYDPNADGATVNDKAEATIKVSDTFAELFTPEEQKITVNRASASGVVDLSKIIHEGAEMSTSTSVTISNDDITLTDIEQTLLKDEKFISIFEKDPAFFKHVKFVLDPVGPTADRTVRNITVTGIEKYYTGTANIKVNVKKTDIAKELGTLGQNADLSISFWDAISANKNDNLNKGIINELNNEIKDANLSDTGADITLDDVNITVGEMQAPNGKNETTLPINITASETSKNFTGSLTVNAIVKSSTLQSAFDDALKGNVLDLSNEAGIDSTSSESQISDVVTKYIKDKTDIFGDLGKYIETVNWTGGVITVTTTANAQNILTGSADMNLKISLIDYAKISDSKDDKTATFTNISDSSNIVNTLASQFLDVLNNPDKTADEIFPSKDVQNKIMSVIYNVTTTYYEGLSGNKPIFTKGIGKDFETALSEGKISNTKVIIEKHDDGIYLGLELLTTKPADATNISYVEGQTIKLITKVPDSKSTNTVKTEEVNIVKKSKVKTLFNNFKTLFKK